LRDFVHSFWRARFILFVRESFWLITITSSVAYK